MVKIVLLEDPHPGADLAYENANVEVQRISGSLGEAELIAALQDCQDTTPELGGIAPGLMVM